MWRTSCLLWTALTLGLTGVILDVMITQKGETQEPAWKVHSTVDYGWSEFKLVMRYKGDNSGNITDTITYDEAYRKICKHEKTMKNRTMCEDLKDMDRGGELYLGFDLTANTLLIFALLIAVVLSCARLLFDKRCPHPSRYVVAALTLLSSIFFTVAFICYVVNYSTKLEDIVRIIMIQYPGLNQYTEVEWEDPDVGVSMILLAIASFLTVIVIIIALTVDEKYDNGPEVEGQIQYDPVFKRKKKAKKRKTIVVKRRRTTKGPTEVDTHKVSELTDYSVSPLSASTELQLTAAVTAVSNADTVIVDGDYVYAASEQTEATELLLMQRAAGGEQPEADRRPSVSYSQSVSVVFEHPFFKSLGVLAFGSVDANAEYEEIGGDTTATDIDTVSDIEEDGDGKETDSRTELSAANPQSTTKSILEEKQRHEDYCE